MKRLEMIRFVEFAPSTIPSTYHMFASSMQLTGNPLPNNDVVGNSSLKDGFHLGILWTNEFDYA